MAALKITAVRSNMDKVLKFVDGLLDGRGCSSKIRTQLDIVVDELFTNIVSYAYGEEVGEAVVELDFEGDVAAITFRDWGIPYNPLERPDPDITIPVEKRPIGGLGVYMVKQLTDSASYRYEDGQNVLTVRKSL